MMIKKTNDKTNTNKTKKGISKSRVSKAKEGKVASKKRDQVMKTKASEMVIVGIGASAGGLEALRAIISGLPVQDDITYVIAQHLDPHHSSMLGSILLRDTDIPVIELKTEQVLEPSNLYIIPPGNDKSRRWYHHCPNY